jgi:hypothetical protein
VLTWQNRITRIRERCTDLFGRHGWRWRVIRTSNAYQLCAQGAEIARFASTSENRTGTPNQVDSMPVPAPAAEPDSPLERALARFGAAVTAKLLSNEGDGTLRAT